MSQQYSFFIWQLSWNGGVGLEQALASDPSRVLHVLGGLRTSQPGRAQLCLPELGEALEASDLAPFPHFTDRDKSSTKKHGNKTFANSYLRQVVYSFEILVSLTSNYGSSYLVHG